MNYLKSMMVLLCLSLASCSSDRGPDLLDDYLNRLANVLNLDLDAYAKKQDESQGYPSNWTKHAKRTVLYEAQSDATIDILDFLSLYGCALQVTVAERNSSMGKLAQPSQQLLYELKFLAQAPSCINQLMAEEQEALAKQLDAAAQAKRDKLLVNLWRVILVGNEAQQFWQMPNHLQAYPDQGMRELLSSLRTLKELVVQWRQGNYQSGHAELEKSLFWLAQGEGGQLFKALFTYIEKLKLGNSLLQARLADACHNDRPNYNQIALQNVVNKFFVGGVQQWSAEVSQRYYQMMPLFRVLEDEFIEVESAEYKVWRRQRDAVFELLTHESQLHVKALGRLMDGCDK